jgi:TatD DNase family protein
MLFDTHAHLYFDSLKDTTEEIITRMRENNVTRSIQIGCDIETSEKAIALARAYPEVFHATV